jgi:hypothetical protein
MPEPWDLICGVMTISNFRAHASSAFPIAARLSEPDEWFNASETTLIVSRPKRLRFSTVLHSKASEFLWLRSFKVMLGGVTGDLWFVVIY